MPNQTSQTLRKLCVNLSLSLYTRVNVNTALVDSVSDVEGKRERCCVIGWLITGCHNNAISTTPTWCRRFLGYLWAGCLCGNGPLGANSACCCHAEAHSQTSYRRHLTENRQQVLFTESWVTWRCSPPSYMAKNTKHYIVHFCAVYTLQGAAKK